MFRHATNWKRYFGDEIASHITGDVLEVGAGLGGTTTHLLDGRQRSWLCLEPDPAQACTLSATMPHVLAGVPVSTAVGTVATLAENQRFDCILYIDVLEHIESDRGELGDAAARLRPGGVLVVLAPAHNWLYSPFDKRIGHYRRYSVKQLAALTPPGTTVLKAWYLDAVGLLASAANRVLLSQSMPTATQIRFWDRWMVRSSRVIDPIVGHRLGKTVVVVWRRSVSGLV